MKTLIAGAGAAGLAIAWRLAQAGAAVEILERGRAGRGATWAAAGMLAPGVELGAEEDAFSRFAQRARIAWPAFAAELQAASGYGIGYREPGSLILAESVARMGLLQDRLKQLQRRGLEAKWLSPETLGRCEPLLSPELLGALHVPGDAQVDNRALAEALGAAAALNDAVLRECCEVHSLILEKDRVRGVVTSQGAIEGDAVILASGAWLNTVSGTSELPPVAPVKGQIVALEPPEGTVLPAPLLWNDDVYLVPRQGRLFAGATVEDTGFDTSVTREACNRLHAAAARVIPAARDWRIAEAWAGLRPRAPDSMPVLGETHIAGLFVAGGQFRNGILFAPQVAELLTRAVLGQPLAADDAVFDPKRFSGR